MARKDAADTLTRGVDARRVAVAAELAGDQQARLGQFFTPQPVADFLASLFTLTPGDCRLLDPGAGVGSLTAAVVARMLREQVRSCLSVTAFEVDGALTAPLKETLSECESATDAVEGLTVTTQLEATDFIEWATDEIAGHLFASEVPQFDCVIMNPPYGKLGRTSTERRHLRAVGIDAPNVYAAFLSLAVRLLAPGGQLVAITPRSFANGPYFRPFRKELLEATALTRLHVYESRSSAFKDSDVLQENVVFHAVKSGKPADVVVSASHGLGDEAPTLRTVPYADVVRPGDPECFINLVTGDHGAVVAQRMTALPHSLADLGVNVSTGRVVDFRAKEFLRPEPETGTVPLIYPTHLTAGRIEWPKQSKKPNAFVLNADSASQVMPEGVYVLVKRFTSKEERRRVVAAVIQPDDVRGPYAFENHLNVYHSNGDGLPVSLARGVAGFLNSTYVDLYLRQFSGHTQVNATDLRNLRYPPASELEALGNALGDSQPEQSELDQAVREYLTGLGHVAGEADPLASHERVTQAQDVLRQLGFPKEQQNERSALTLLALADMSPTKDWSDAASPLCGITQMMDWFRDEYGKQYAPNTRETVRRQTVHQFLAAGLVAYNPDKPDRAVNSPKATYQLTPEALALLKTYGGPDWDSRLAIYTSERVSLRQKWAAEREMNRLPVTLPDGSEVALSPGGQNVLIKEVVEGFCSRFTPGGHVLYIGDADEKFAVFQRDALAALGVEVEEHGKMPDLVVYHGDEGWLLLVEAVTSHGPVNPKRHDELRALFAGASVGLVYVTAFLDAKTFAKYVPEIAWETEVWVAESPTHIIHFDGERFLGPYE